MSVPCFKQKITDEQQISSLCSSTMHASTEAAPEIPLSQRRNISVNLGTNVVTSGVLKCKSDRNREGVIMSSIFITPVSVATPPLWRQQPRRASTVSAQSVSICIQQAKINCTLSNFKEGARMTFGALPFVIPQFLFFLLKTMDDQNACFERVEGDLGYTTLCSPLPFPPSIISSPLLFQPSYRIYITLFRFFYSSGSFVRRQ